MRSSQIFLIITCLLVVSCSSFHQQWREAKSQQGTHDLTGPWEGRWVSAANGHGGKLRCVVSPQAAKPESYNFNYWAKWGIFSGSFATIYPVEQVADGRWTFAGDSDLGSLGGVYHHAGEATPDRFKADYTSSKGDRGTMEMTRPE
ncbi:MAG: hypothetical protein ACI8T1_002523 [Verrucomicrobiales bacterium]|jgi:hypothetical protein